MIEIDRKPEFPLKKEERKIFVKLNEQQIEKKLEFINKYIESNNAADGSGTDANSNVANKNLHTLEYEINKDINIQVNRKIIYNKIKELFNEDLANDYIKMLEDHIIYTHDETSLKPYCVSITMYPFLLNGLKDLDPNGSSAPKNLSSFCGGFINLMLAVSSQFAGAVATGEFLMYFNYFAEKAYGLNYLETNKKEIESYFSQVVYTINQPSVSRGYQSIFWNISIYDKEYFQAMFDEFVFPDGSKPNYDNISKLQKIFMHWFNNERTKAILTFPVITAACLNDGNKLKDKDFENFITKELSEGNSFFIYTSDNASALSSCCFSGDEIIEVELNNIKQKMPIRAFVSIVKNKIIDLKKQHVLINSWNQSTDSFEKTRVTDVLEKSLTDRGTEMYKVSTESNSIIITGDHIVPVKNYNNKLETKNIKYYYKIINKYKEKEGLCCPPYLYTKPIYKVKTTSGSWEEITIDKIKKETNTIVYDIQLQKNHYFPANNIITHNCRLRNSVEDQLKEFSNTLGAGGVATGSLNVITLNLNMIAQKGLSLRSVLDKVYKFQVSFRKLYDYYNEKGLLPVYSAKYITMNKQFLTIGINGLVESAEFYGLKININDEYNNYTNRLLNIISSMNVEAKKQYGYKFNTELVPAENLGVKQAKWEADTEVELYEIENDDGIKIKYPINTKCYLKDGTYKLIQDIDENDFNNIVNIDKYSSFLD